MYIYIHMYMYVSNIYIYIYIYVYICIRIQYMMSIGDKWWISTEKGLGLEHVSTYLDFLPRHPGWVSTVPPKIKENKGKDSFICCTSWGEYEPMIEYHVAWCTLSLWYLHLPHPLCGGSEPICISRIGHITNVWFQGRTSKYPHVLQTDALTYPIHPLWLVGQTNSNQWKSKEISPRLDWYYGPKLSSQLGLMITQKQLHLTMRYRTLNAQKTSSVPS